MSSPSWSVQQANLKFSMITSGEEHTGKGAPLNTEHRRYFQDTTDSLANATR